MKSVFSMILAFAWLWASVVQAQAARYGMVELPASDGNPYTLVGPSGTMVWSGLFDALTVVEEDGSLQPALATDWRQVDALTWDFTLRENVVFADGSPFNAAAVVAAYGWLKTDAGRITLVGQEVRTIESVEIVAPDIVRFRTRQPDAILPVRTSLVAIVEPDAWSELGPEGFARAPIGTGSFVVREWPTAGTDMVMHAVPTSWRPPVTEQIVVRVIPQAVSRTQALITGEVDVVESIAFDDVDVLRAAGLEVMASATPQVMALAFINVGRPDAPLSDKRVRQALNYAVDRDGIALGLTGGITRPTAQPAIPGMAAYNETVTPYPYDPEKARALLTDAGYPNGFPLIINVVVGGYIPADAAIYQKVAEDLRAIGLDVTLQAIPIQIHYARLIQGADRSGVDAFGSSYQGHPFGDPLRSMRQNSCLWHAAYFCDPSVAPLLEQAATAPTPEERTSLLKDLAVQYKDIAPSLFIVAQAEVIGVSPRLTNVRRRNRTLVLHEIGVREE